MVYLFVIILWAVLFTGTLIYTGWRIGCWLFDSIRLWRSGGSSRKPYVAVQDKDSQPNPVRVERWRYWQERQEQLAREEQAKKKGE
jgi:hypothetical protein